MKHEGEQNSFVEALLQQPKKKKVEKHRPNITPTQYILWL